MTSAQNASYSSRRLIGGWILDRRVRSAAIQAALLALIAAILWAAAHNALYNMQARGIPTGLGFWDNPAGFNINQSLIPFDSATSTYGDAFVVGLINTLLVAALGILFATILGFIIGIARLSENFLIARCAEVYVETIRNVPLLLQLLFWYNAVLRQLPSPRRSLVFLGAALNDRGLVLPAPVLRPGAAWVGLAFLIALAAAIVWIALARRSQAATGAQRPMISVALALVICLPAAAFILAGRPASLDYPVLRGFNYNGGLHVFPEFVALLLGLTIYTAAFIAEVVRSGIAAVDRGQLEAARALGLTGGLSLRLVIIPQALRVIIPPLTNQYLNLTKNSSLAVFIGYPDLVQVFAGTVLNQTGAAVQVIGITMAVYLAISLATSAAMAMFNRRVALVER